jgi:hypothetical protein
MTSPLSFPADHVITGKEWAQFLDFLVPVYRRKPSGELVTSSTTLQDDDDLYLLVQANATYHVQCHIIYSADVAADLLWNWTAPTGSAFDWHMGAAEANAAASAAADTWWQASTLLTNESAAGVGSGVKMVAQPTGLLRTSTTAGYFRIQWAQRSSSGTSTDVKVGSALFAHRVA